MVFNASRIALASAYLSLEATLSGSLWLSVGTSAAGERHARRRRRAQRLVGRALTGRGAQSPRTSGSCAARCRTTLTRVPLLPPPSPSPAGVLTVMLLGRAKGRGEGGSGGGEGSAP